MYKQFTNKHDAEITAEKAYSYSKECVILNKDRVVICYVPSSQIEDSLSWIEVGQKSDDVERIFNLAKSQMKKFDDWRKKKNKSKKGEPYAGAAGGAYTFCFTPTGLGTVAKVMCIDGTELDITHENEFS